MEAEDSPEMLIATHKVTWCHNPEDPHPKELILIQM
jgi:hypothetical protein